MLAQSDKFLWLEGLRGALAVVVCVGHYGVNTVLARYGTHLNFGLAVDVFFVMSGFVLSRAYFFSKRPWGEFIVGRFARLYPLHFATAIVAGVIACSWHSEHFVSVLVQNVFLLQNVGLAPNDPGPNYPNWSISVELWVAVVFFLGIRFLGTIVPSVVLLATVPVVLLLADFPNAFHHNYFLVVNAGVLRGLTGFSVGIAAYLAYRKVQLESVSSWVAAALTVPFALLFFADKSNASNLLLMYATSFFLVIALALFRGPRGPFAVVLATSGAISYSAYLIHVPVYLLAERMLGAPHVPGAAAVWSLPVVAIVAPVSAFLFEKPAQRWLVGYFRKQQFVQPIAGA